MFHLDSYPIQRGRGNFNVERYPLQRGRGLGGLFAGLLRKFVPFGKSFLKTGKNIIQSETGKSILNDTLQTAAAAASSALLENDAEGAKKQLINSLKRSSALRQQFSMSSLSPVLRYVIIIHYIYILLSVYLLC